MVVGSKNQTGRGRFKHRWIELKFGLDILFILENSWFNYIGDQRKSPKNETPYNRIMQHVETIISLVYVTDIVMSVQCPTHC